MAMADIFTSEKRSFVMSRIRGKGNLKTELKMLGIFAAHGIKGWRRHLALPGKPDFAFRNAKVAVFVDGCFWHGCPKHGRIPDSNQSYWIPKLARNKRRDRRVSRLLRKKSWLVLRFWEHALADGTKVAHRVKRTLCKASIGRGQSGLLARKPAAPAAPKAK